MEFILKRDENGYLSETKVKADSYDSWNGDQTIAYVAASVVQQVITDSHGWKYVDAEDLPQEMREEYEAAKVNEDDDVVKAGWMWVLNEMLFALVEIRDCGPTDPCNEPNVKINEEFANRIYAYEARVQNGCRLFGVYFQGLWT